MIMHSEGRYYALLDHGVGSFYETDDANFNPNKKWGGTWELDQTGTVLVSKSSTSGSAFNVAADTVVGEEKHTLSVDELPSHSHNLYVNAGGSAWGWHLQTTTPEYNSSTPVTSTPVGANKSHNNIQPSKVIYRWHRTA